MFGKDENGRDVVSMTARERHQRRAPLRQVETYWQALCEDGKVPMRSQIDPRGIEAALENAFLLERIAPGMAKFRVAGSHVGDLLGMQVAGMPLACLMAPKDRDQLRRAITPLFEEAVPLHLSLQAETGLGKPALSAEMVLLPLRSDFGDLTRALGAIVTHGRLGRTPRRFLLDSHSAGQAPMAETTPALPDRRPAPQGLAEPAQPFTPAPPKVHLRLVVSND